MRNVAFLWKDCLVLAVHLDSGVTCYEAAPEMRDSHLACSPHCAGPELIGPDVEGRREVFRSPDELGQRDDVLACSGNAAGVRSPVFLTTIRDMKALLHDA
jgi:hypothetical protein